MTPTVQNKSSDSLAALLFAVFAVVAIIAFLAYRGGDVGQLPNLIGHLGGGPLAGIEVIRDSFVGILVAVLIGISWFGLGSIFLRFVRLGNRSSRLFEIVVTIALGAGIWSLIWFFLGLSAMEPSPYGSGSRVGAGFLSFIWFYARIVGLYSQPVAVVAVLIGIAMAIFGILWLRKSDDAANAVERRSVLRNVLIAIIGFVMFLALVASLAPPTAKDTLLYHFAVAKALIAQGGSAFLAGNVASYLTLGTEMHSVWAMLLGNIISPRAADAAAGVTAFLFFPLLLLAIYGWTRESGVSRTWTLIATLLVAAIPSAYHVASRGYIDLSLTLFVTLAIYALTRWWKEQTTGWVILIGIFLGAALSIKLTAIFLVAAFGLVVLFRTRGAKYPVPTPVGAPGSDTVVVAGAGKIVVSGFAALLLGVVIASPWYLRAWVATGSPVFLFYMSIWPGKANGWDVERSNLFQEMNSQYGGADTNKLNYLTAPARVSIMAQPEQPQNYDGVLGVSFFIGLPLLIWALWKFDLPVEAKIGAGVAGVMYLFWLFSSEQLRYLVPILPVLAIAIAASVETTGAKIGALKTIAQYTFIAAAICGISTTAAWFCQKAPLRVILGGETRDQYLTRNLDYYPYYQTLNSDTPPDAKVWLINMRRDTYNIDRPVFLDYLFEDWTLRKMVWEARNVQEMRTKTVAMGIKYVLTRHDFLFDYDRSTLVDDKKPRAENEAKLKIAKDFILDPRTPFARTASLV